MTTKRFEVMTASGHVSGKARQYGRYRRVAVVETDGIELPKMISERAIHCVRIVRDWGSCSEGKTERCEYRRALAEADALADRMNAASACAMAEEAHP